MDGHLENLKGTIRQNKLASKDIPNLNYHSQIFYTKKNGRKIQRVYFLIDNSFSILTHSNKYFY